MRAYARVDHALKATTELAGAQFETDRARAAFSSQRRTLADLVARSR
ncbi:MAG: hypothetical protein MSC30_02160 [Gaiellaceae bacterium MAG52_C11]|nr:hypothetical protein [Candidatus Gaiellasilicea maunaloa]